MVMRTPNDHVTLQKGALLIFIAFLSFVEMASSPPLVKVPQIGIITNAHPSGCIVMSSACLASRGGNGAERVLTKRDIR